DWTRLRIVVLPDPEGGDRHAACAGELRSRATRRRGIARRDAGAGVSPSAAATDRGTGDRFVLPGRGGGIRRLRNRACVGGDATADPAAAAVQPDLRDGIGFPGGSGTRAAD